MASDPSKTEKATPKRRKKVRQEGNVPKSQEVTKLATIVAGVIGLYVYFPFIVNRVRGVFEYFFGHAVEIEINGPNAYSIILLTIRELAIMIMPVLLFIGLVAYIVLRKQVGKLWTTKVFKFKWSNFNIFNGLKRMFVSPQTFIRLGKSLGMALIIGIVPYMFIKNEFHNFLPMYYADAEILGIYMLKTGFRLVIYTLTPMVIIAGVDAWYTWYQYEENIKMSKQEVKDEHRSAEGDPLIKNKQKQKMMAVMAQRMMKQVPKSDVVVTNPTHYAVALRYDPTVSPAPLVVAKGVDKVAEKIKTIAREHRIPIRPNPPLARTLYKEVEIGQPIPEDLYKTVAALLAEIWKMQGKMPPPRPQ